MMLGFRLSIGKPKAPRNRSIVVELREDGSSRLTAYTVERGVSKGQTFRTDSELINARDEFLEEAVREAARAVTLGEKSQTRVLPSCCLTNLKCATSHMNRTELNRKVIRGLRARKNAEIRALSAC